MDNNKKDEAFAERLVRLRLALPLRYLKPVRIKDVSEEAGVNVNSYSTAESGIVPGTAVLSKIAKYYDVTEDYLLGKGKAPPSTPIYKERLQEAHDDKGLFGKTEHTEKNGLRLAVTTHEPKGDGYRMSPIRAMESLTTILQSGNSTIIRAIISNLEAFGSAVEQESRDKARIEALEKECEGLKARLSDLEKKMDKFIAEQLAAQEQRKTANAKSTK